MSHTSRYLFRRLRRNVFAAFLAIATCGLTHAQGTAPDGKTLFLSHDHTISILPQVVKNPGFDPAYDFVAVAGFATFVNAFAVSGGTPARSVADYVTG